jgi:hypothetical protein
MTECWETVLNVTSKVPAREQKKRKKKETKREAPKSIAIVVVGRRGNLKR